MDDWLELTDLTDLISGTGRTLRVQDKEVAIFSVNGELLAIDDTCPHAGASLGRGKLEGCVVKCPAHGMKFDLRSGCMPSVPDFGLKAYSVKQEDGKFWISLHNHANNKIFTPIA
jgi:3-phenylpropionate/trans-cinnamate dioxygenase ferredoxin component